LGKDRVGAENAGEPGDQSTGHRRSLQELPAPHGLIGLAVAEFLRDLGIPTIIRVWPFPTAAHALPIINTQGPQL